MPHLIPLNVVESLKSNTMAWPFTPCQKGKVSWKCTPIKTERAKLTRTRNSESPSNRTTPQAPSISVSLALHRFIYLVSTNCFRSVWHTSSRPAFQDLFKKFITIKISKSTCILVSHWCRSFAKCSWKKQYKRRREEPTGLTACNAPINVKPAGKGVGA